MRTLWTHRGTWIAAAFMIVTGTASMSHAADSANTAAIRQSPADNTARNARDQSGDTMTAQKQSNSTGDVEITRQIRRAIVKDDTLSTNAHNVKIVTVGGMVTLRGPVASKEEKANVGAKAEAVAGGASKIDNQLEVAAR